MKETVKDGKLVSYAYKLYDNDNGELLFEAPKDAPDTMIYGVSQDIIPGILAALKGLAAGDKFSVTLPPEVAFGPYYADNVIELDREMFTRDGKLVAEVKVGADLPMMTDQGMMVKGRVTKIDDKHVTMDFNHPFAGKTVKIDGEVVDLRDATPEEIAKVQGCGCGCGHDHGSCSDGCCGGHDHHHHDGGCCGNCN